MKTKVLIVAIAVVALANHVLGQGQVVLANNATTLVWDPFGNPVPVGSVLFQLYFAAGVNQPAASLSPVGPIVGTSTIAAGRVANTVIDIPTAVVPAGGAATFQVWTWSSSFASYNAAALGGGLIGKSITFNATTSVGGPPPPLPVSLAGLWPGIGIPEPSTIVLAGMGVVSLLFFRRRKRS